MKVSMHWLVLSVALLSGCDAVENAANKAAEDAKESATQIARETLSESLSTFSEQIDKAQEKTDTWLNGEPSEEARDKTRADEVAQPAQNEA